MHEDSAPRRVARLLRLFSALILALNLSGVSHAAEEFVENVVHVAETGHGAHATDHPEGHADRSTEHDCFGNVHHCGCCRTAVAAAFGSPLLPEGTTHRVAPPSTTGDNRASGVRARIDRPPRA